MNNPILNVDSYKTSHWKQYPPGTKHVSSYIEARTDRKTVFFGLQAFLIEYLSKPITFGDIVEAAGICKDHGVPFNYEGWIKLLQKHNGFFPVSIQAVPEGTVVDGRNVLLQIVNTDEEFPWVISYLETALLRAIWYPSTVATNSREIKEIIKTYLMETADNLGGLPFKLHDFGARGVSSEESASLGGLGHLVNFKGTDTMSALVAAKKYYGESMAGFSIPAAEHSTITSWGKPNESKAYANMVTQFGHKGSLVAVVSDSYDIHAAVEKWTSSPLLAQVQESGCTVVIRPDSGDPAETIMGILHKFLTKGLTKKNSKGYHMLPDYFRLIQGDGVNIGSIKEILEEMKYDKYSADNIAFGMGGALLQGVTRDTDGYAMKCSAIDINGHWQDVFKEAPGKASKKGRLALINLGHKFETVRQENCQFENNKLVEVWRNGKLLKFQTFEEIRNRAEV